VLLNFSNFGSLKSTEMPGDHVSRRNLVNFSNFGSLKSTEIPLEAAVADWTDEFQQFRLVEEH